MTVRANGSKAPITVLLAVKNEAANLPRCLAALGGADRVVVLDSHSSDGTQEIAWSHGAEVIQFDYHGGYPKKRQWALDTLSIRTPWTLLLDADEIVPEALWLEIEAAIAAVDPPDAFLITKGFHFLGRRLKFGGFSHSAVLLFRTGLARFERLLEDQAGTPDMEIHERVVVDGRIGRLSAPLIHDDLKGMEAYIARHNGYSTWEAKLRYQYLTTGSYGEYTIRPRLFGNEQERRRFIKRLVLHVPFEPWLWFLYHYLVRLGFLEGRAGLIACQIRASYIAQVRTKLNEMQLQANSGFS
jgi:glycosyltransferase involved in cell wall biosynthesis